MSLSTSHEALQLARDPGTEANARVHKIRVATKKLRATWYLFRSGRMRASAKRAITSLRDAARELAAQRDKTVVREVLTDLAADSPGLAEPMPDTNQGNARLVELLQTEHDTWLEFDPKPLRKTLLFKSLRRTYRRARRSGKLAAKNSSDYELRHQWRKWVKYLYYQLEILEQCGLSGQRKLIDRLDQLGEALGNEHDLYVLRQRIKSRNNHNTSSVIGELKRNQKLCRRRSEQLAKSIFVNGPNKFMKKLHKKDHLFFSQP